MIYDWKFCQIFEFKLSSYLVGFDYISDILLTTQYNALLKTPH